MSVNLCNSLNLNQWKNIQEVIDWFMSTGNKQHYKFIMFDIRCLTVNFEGALNRCLNFWGNNIELDDHDK